MILGDLVHYQFDRLRPVRETDPYRLVQIHTLLLELVVVYQHHHVEPLVLGIGLAQFNTQGTDARILLGLVEGELVVVALAALLQYDHFIMRSRDGAIQLVLGRVDFTLKIITGLTELRTTLKSAVVRTRGLLWTREGVGTGASGVVRASRSLIRSPTD